MPDPTPGAEYAFIMADGNAATYQGKLIVARTLEEIAAGPFPSAAVRVDAGPGPGECWPPAGSESITVTEWWAAQKPGQKPSPIRATVRRFVLQRDQDVTGFSGTGVIVEGCEFSSGMVAMTWLGQFSSWCWYPSMETLVQVHGHDGKTRVIWLDEA